MNAVRAHSGTILLYGLHLLIALSLPFVLALVVGCMKITEEQPDYGPEVDGDAIDLALSKAINGASINGIAVGQNIKYTITRRLEAEETTTLLGGVQVEVFDKQESATETKYMLKVTKSERTTGNGQFEVKVTEEPIIFEKASLTSAITPSNFHSFDTKSVHATADRKVIRTSYHRLREFTQFEAPPKAVRDRPGCGGLDPCQMELRYIRFDLVQWFEDGGRQKVSLDFAFSVSTPYLPFGPDRSLDRLNGILVTNCQSLYVPIEGRTVYVRDCQNLEDFQK